ncbi:hypothetical protein P9112_004762 [Eukaryota sp. TZLM1-RC]
MKLFYVDDVVCTSSSDSLALVTSVFDDQSDSSDSEDLLEDTAVCTYFNNCSITKKIESFDKLVLKDRSFAAGDIVTLSNSTTPMSGIVLKSRFVLDLQSIDSSSSLSSIPAENVSIYDIDINSPALLDNNCVVNVLEASLLVSLVDLLSSQESVILYPNDSLFNSEGKELYDIGVDQIVLFEGKQVKVTEIAPLSCAVSVIYPGNSTFSKLEVVPNVAFNRLATIDTSKILNSGAIEPFTIGRVVNHGGKSFIVTKTYSTSLVLFQNGTCEWVDGVDLEPSVDSSELDFIYPGVCVGDDKDCFVVKSIDLEKGVASCIKIVDSTEVLHSLHTIELLTETYLPGSLVKINSSESQKIQNCVGYILDFDREGFSGNFKVVTLEGDYVEVDILDVECSLDDSDDDDSSSSDDSSDSEEEYHEEINKKQQVQQEIDSKTVLDPDLLNAEFARSLVTCDSEFPTHSLFNSPQVPSSSSLSINLVRRISQELRSLSELPSNIHVFQSARNIALFTAVIIGPEDTPFERIPFVFDLALPQSYPNVPPLVKFVSFGYNLHPNLFPSGHVCLSLINTWKGREESESWTADGGSLTRVLLSFSAMILGSKYPFFDESGNDLLSRTPSLLGRSKLYNERCVVLVLKYFHSLVLKLPTNVATFIQNYLRFNLDKIIHQVEQALCGQSMAIERPTEGFVSEVTSMLEKLRNLTL